MTEPDRTITPDEAEEIMSEEIWKSPDKVTAEVDVKQQSIMVSMENTPVSLQFISIRDNPEILIKEDGATATVSRYLIHTEDETLEVETNGAFELALEGPGVEEILGIPKHE